MSSLSSSGRPMRLRNACLNCTSAKVKCSGQKTGCNRCSKTGSECVYLESMAGRVPKKHKVQLSGGLSSDGRQPAQSSDQALSGQNLDSSSFAHFDMGDDSGLSTPDDDTTLSLMSGQLSGNHSNHHLVGEETVGAFEIPFAAFDHSFPTNILTSSPDDFQTDDLTSPFDCSPTFAGAATRDDTLSSDSMDVAGTFPQSSHTHNGFSMSLITPPRKGSLDEQCVLAATQIINALENCIARPHQLDVVLRTVRKAGVGLNGLIDLQRNLDRRGRCVILFTMILYQNLDLLETVMSCLGLINPKDGAQINSMTSPRPWENMTKGQPEHLDAINCHIASLKFSFGCKESPQLKTTWTRKVLEELSFCLETVARVTILMQASSLANGPTAQEETYNNGSYVELLKSRFEQLQLLAQSQI
ncbi:hypothetical protein F4804DRAFT_325154 [Jackrogersella minutella]|nr:hypothetical protein F4804DRAFT_325154 [Jackrogersella minutella]